MYPADQPPESGGGTKRALRELVETVAIALAVALIIRTFVIQLYVVDGASMYPTLHHGDRLLVNKLVYRFSDPKPGDVVVLADPGGGRRQLVKRVIAVGGETVEVRSGVVLVDGKPLDEPFTNPASVHFRDVPPTTVPEGYVYVMGDNRGESLDSRIFGPIPASDVVGKALFLFWPPQRAANHGPLEARRAYLD